MTNKITLELFPSFVGAVVLVLSFSEILSSTFNINGEYVYTCGFIIILYLIWDKTHNLCGTVFKSQFGSNEFTIFW